MGSCPATRAFVDNVATGWSLMMGDERDHKTTYHLSPASTTFPRKSCFGPCNV